MNVLIISAEVAPFAKVGGLADVAGALPKALHRQGHDVRVVMPCYKMIETNPQYAVEEIISSFIVPVSQELSECAFVKQTTIPIATDRSRTAEPTAATQTLDRIPVYLIGSPEPGTAELQSEEVQSTDRQTAIDQPPVRSSGYFQQATRSQKVYTLEPEPYLFFCRAVLEMLNHLSPAWKPDILHCNDWQTGMVPVYARTFYQANDLVANAATLFTIHNLAYQGNFDCNQWRKTGLPDALFHVDGLEFYGQWTFMKGGVQFSDRVNTVSPNYAREIQTPEYGVGLDGLMRLKANQGRLSGILNGIDYDEYDPETDPRLPAHFNRATPAGKADCKAALQRELGLPVTDTSAIIGVVSRLADQKGFDLIRANIEEMLALPVQFVLLGTGDQNYERYFKELQANYPAQVHAAIAFDIELAQRIYAGSDLFLMPSRFEPCGLGQLFALRYGTIPIVRATGGLADTITDYDPVHSPDGNGFRFSDYSVEAMADAIRHACLYDIFIFLAALVIDPVSIIFSSNRTLPSPIK